MTRLNNLFLALFTRSAIAFAVGLLSPHAAADFGEYIRHDLAGQTLTVTTTSGELRLAALGEGALEVHYVEPGIKQLPSFAIAEDLVSVSANAVVTDEQIVFAISGLTAVIDKSPLRIAYRRGDEVILQEEVGYFAHQTLRGFRFHLREAEKVLGGGERVMGMDRRGQRMPLYNRASYGYTTEARQMYYGLPAVMSSEKYIIVFDNSASGHLDIGATEKDVLQFEAVAGRTAYLVMAADNYPALLSNYTGATGRQPLPPRWALGNYASRFGYHSEKEARATVTAFRRQDIPLDAIVLDLYWFGPDIQGHMGNLDWDREAFAQPEKMIRDFARDGVNTILITEPFVLTTSKKWQDAVASNALATSIAGVPRRFDFYFGNTGLIDVFNDDGRTWFADVYRRLFAQGVAGSWGDLGEPEVHPGDSLHWLSDAAIRASGDEVHNAYGHEWARLVHTTHTEQFPDKRPFIMMRSGFAGSQRYGMIPWTGDVGRSWGGLKPQVELSLQMSLLGLAYTHSDLGGFAGGDHFNSELYIRWLQYGVFQPVYRPHAHEAIAPEPVFHDRATRNIVREFIKLRYRLLPYNYTLAFKNSQSGMPLMRPLFFADESDATLIDNKQSYLWGDAFLVTPVTDPGVDAVEVSVPDGVWFDYFSEEKFVGGRDVRVPVTLQTIPVLVRAGSFVPMTGAIKSTRDYSSEQLTLHYYADASVTASDGIMFDDDGRTRDSVLKGQYELLQFAATQEGGASLTIELSRTALAYAGMPDARDMTLVVHNWPTDASAVAIGEHCVARAKRGLGNRGSGCRANYDSRSRQLTIRFRWDHTATTIRIR